MKSELRKQIKKRRNTIVNKEELAMASAHIAKQLEENPVFKQAQIILLFYSLPDEPDTHSLVERWYRDKQILLPVCSGNNLLLRQYTGSENLRTGSFSIMEPAGDDFTAYDKIDLAIIPGVAFDKAGHRLGRGKGYYDRLLSHPLFRNVYKLGVAFGYQIVETVPCSNHDIPVDEILYY